MRKSNKFWGICFHFCKNYSTKERPPRFIGLSRQELIYLFRANGYSTDYLLDFSIGTDIKNSTARVIYFDQPHLGMSREYLIKGEYRSIIALMLRPSMPIAVGTIVISGRRSIVLYVLRTYIAHIHLYVPSAILYVRSTRLLIRSDALQ